MGATGTGKSGLLENLILQDIKQNIGCAVLDPHGDLIEKILSRIDRQDEEKVIYLDCLNKQYSFGLNLYHCPDPSDSESVIRTFEQVEHVFELLWGRDIEIATRPDLSQAIRNTAYSLIYNSDTSYSGCGLVDLPLLYEEDIPRSNIIAALPGRSDRLFTYWNRFNTLSETRQREFSQMLVSRSERFILNNIVRHIVGQSRTTINFREVMDQGLILLCRLPGNFEDTTELLGSMVVAEILSAALSRSDIKDAKKRRHFSIYCDEFQRFSTPDFHRLLTECRKYAQAVTISHQARDFIDLKNKAATLQAANIAVFRVIGKDAAELAPNFNCDPIPGEVRHEYKRTIISDPASYYLTSGKRHPNPLVNNFLQPWRQDAIDAKRQIRDKDMSPESYYVPRNRGVPEHYVRKILKPDYDSIVVKHARRTMDEINGFLFQVMTEKRYQIPPIGLVQVIAAENKLPFYDLEALLSEWTPRYKGGGSKYPPRDYFCWFIDLELEIKETQKKRPYPMPTDALVEAYNTLWFTTDLENAFSVYESLVRKALLNDMLFACREFCQSHCVAANFDDLPDRPAAPARLFMRDMPFEEVFKIWLKDGEIGFLENANLTLKTLQWEQTNRKEDMYYNGDWWLVVGQETNWIPYIQEEIERIVAHCKPSFEQFVREFRTVMQALIDEPVEDISGVVEEKHTEVPSHEVANRIANQLSRLEKHTARVRIQGVSDRLEEYTIETEKPGNGMNGTGLEERKARILKNMVAKRIYRPKAEIEDEIRKRHALLRTNLRQPEVKKEQSMVQAQNIDKPRRPRKIDN